VGKLITAYSPDEIIHLKNFFEKIPNKDKIEGLHYIEN